MESIKQIWNKGIPRVAALGFLFLYLLPVLYVGLAHKSISGIPGYLNTMYSISALFTKRASHWSEFYFQVTVDGQHWVDVPEPIYSTMKPFGNRTRIKRLLQAPMSSKVMTNRYAEIMAFVGQQYERHQDETTKVRLVRLYQAKYFTGSALANCTGAWKREQFEQLTADTALLLARFDCETQQIQWQ